MKTQSKPSRCVSHIRNPTTVFAQKYTEKRTDSHNYLDYFSAHSKHCKDGITCSQFRRLKQNCSNSNAFVKKKEMSHNFIKANYHPEIIRSTFNKVFYMKRELLTLKMPQNSKKETSSSNFLITTFNLNFTVCNKLVQGNWDLLERSSSIQPLLKLQLIKGNRRAKHLIDMLN